MNRNEWAEGNQSGSTWTYSGSPMNPETVVRPEEHYYLRRKVKKRYKFKPRWNFMSIVLLFLIGSLAYQILLGVAGLINYMHNEREREALYQQGMALERQLLSEKKRLESDEYINKRARELSMIKPGEKQYFFAEPLPKDELHPAKKKRSDQNNY